MQDKKNNPARSSNAGVSHYSPEQISRQQEMLVNRVRKNFKHRKRIFQKQSIEAFRLYDQDIPEIRLLIDWYAGHLVIGEFTRMQTEGTNWLELMAEALRQAFELDSAHIHLKRRRTRNPNQGQRYERLAAEEAYITVREGALRFLVNLDDFIDTGLFIDHRIARRQVSEISCGLRVLNLFAYTGSFSCFAAQGGAKSVTTVDLSRNYINWAKRNFELNHLTIKPHEFIVADCLKFLHDAAESKRKWDLIILDPPSYSKRGQSIDFDIQRDHVTLIKEAVSLLSPGGVLFFSTNHQSFTPNTDLLSSELYITEVSESIQSPDCSNRRLPHHSYKIAKSKSPLWQKAF